MESYYDFSQIYLAEVLGVSVGVISCAKSRYTHEKRIDHFATTLKLAIDFFINSLIKMYWNWKSILKPLNGIINVQIDKLIGSFVIL